MTMPVRIFGLPRSGTNLAAYMIEEHVGVPTIQVDSTERKHGLPHLGHDFGAAVYCIKLPQAWLSSMIRHRGVHQHRSDLAVLWSYAALHASRLCKHRQVILVRYDEMLLRPRGVMEEVRDLAVPSRVLTHKEIRVPRHRLLRGGTNVKGRANLDMSTPFDPAFYLRRGYLLSPERHEGEGLLPIEEWHAYCEMLSPSALVAIGARVIPGQYENWT